MKKSIAFVFILIIPMLSFSQIDTLDYYQQRIDHYSQMKRTGVSLAVAGTAITVGGIAMMVSGINEAEDSSFDSDTGIGKTLGGLALLAVGEVALAGGITLYAIGNGKSKQYQKLIEADKNKLSLNMTQDGLTLSFKF